MFTVDFPFVCCALSMYQRKAHDRRKDTAFEVSAFLRLMIQPSRCQSRARNDKSDKKNGGNPHSSGASTQNNSETTAAQLKEATRA
ncbi:hypothetical protein OKW38_000251 [Paraburkholderia sp. MM5496-R1]|uniref:hypothetical protein n=1 Tax=unclassified Paraburkholderia TaxID=2615204 RepID=UPI003D24030F